MTITRRDTLRLAAAFAATRTATFAVSPEDAAAMLDGSAVDDAFPYHLDDLSFDRFAGTVMDPVTFAVEVDSTDTGVDWLFANGAPAEWAAYKQALDRVVALAPDLLDENGSGWQGRCCDHPMVLLDELVVAMGSTMWRAGVVAGAAYEHLRLALTAPVQVCRCNGHGCETCAGQGTLPVTRPALGFFPAD
jgi:hypothetical protein